MSTFVLEQRDAPVRFSSAKGQWRGVFIALVALWLISTALAAAIYWGGYVPNVHRQGNVPFSAHLNGLALILVITFVLVRLGRNELINAVCLYDNHLQFKGWLGAGKFNYDEVKVIRIISIQDDDLPRLRLILEYTRARRRRLWLPSNDAKECFNSLRNLCEHAIGFGLGDQLYLPVNPDFTAAGLLQFAKDRLRKILMKLGGAVLLCAIYPWWLTIPMVTPRYRIGAIALPFFVVVLLFWAAKDVQQFIRFRAAAKRVQAARTGL